MRAKVAKSSYTHALDKDLLALNELELSLLYMQAVRQEEEEKEEKYGLINKLNEIWSNKFDNHFKALQIFIDIDMYKRLQELKDIEVHREEVDEENFLEEWDKMMKVIPEEYIVEENEVFEDLKSMDDELGELLTGWVETSLKYKEER